MLATVFEKDNPRDGRTEGEEKLLNILKNSERFEGWTVFEQPHINAVKPDFVLLHPKKGVIIIEVKDWNLNSNTYESNAYIKGTDGRLHKKNPIDQVEKYKNCILKSDLESNEDFISNNEKYYGYIETVVYFHGVTKSQVLKFCPETKYTKLWTDEDIDYIANIKNLLNYRQYTYALSLEKSKYNQNGTLEKIVEELIKNLKCADYNYERREPFKLTREQSELAKLKHNSVRRWGGVAGAGKSLVLAEKAARALKKNQKVLILTYNITLRHYLRDLCSQQFGVGDYEGERTKFRKNLQVMHFHNFLQSLMAENHITLEKRDYIIDNDNYNDFTKYWIDKIETHLKYNPLEGNFNYDSILIDEGQDFKGDWIRFLKQFYTGNGELFIVYDKEQDLYEHGIWIEDSEQIKNIGFRGQPGTLKYSYRMPSAMIEKIKLVRKNLGIQGENILIPEATSHQPDFLSSIKWINCIENNDKDKLDNVKSKVEELIKENSPEDVTILTTNENTGVDIVNLFKKNSIDGRKLKISHVYDMNKEKDREKRRNEKWKFVGGTGKLKVCSYHSYKGWQTPNIILVLDSNCGGNIENIKQNVSNAIFISMSRVKPNASTGQYSFTCFNYLPEYNRLEKVF
ncbi:NERD domain-containing protein [Intestinibacter sp.]